MGQLLEVTLLQKNNAVLLEPQPLLINAGRINFAEVAESGSGSKILYGSGYGVSQDTLIVEESYATIQAAIESYEPGKTVEVPVIKVDNNVRSFTASISGPGISYVSEDTEDPTNSLILYVQPNMVTFRYYVVELTFSEIQALVDGGGAVWGQITGTLSNQTDLQAALNAKQNTITGGASTITTSNLTADRALISSGAGKVAVSSVTATELGYVSGVTSSIQTQLNAKEVALTFSTGLTRTTNTITNNLSTGVSGGQTVTGGTAASENLTIRSTAHATKGKLLFGNSAYDEVNNRIGIGLNSPTAVGHFRSTGATSGTYSVKAEGDSGSALNFYVRDDGAVSSLNGYWIDGTKVLWSNSLTTNFNLFCGYLSGNPLIGGAALNNSGFGYQTLAAITSGDANAAFGARSLFSLTTGNNNAGFGDYTGPTVSTGSNNVFIGQTSGQSLDNPSRSISIGGNTSSAPVLSLSNVIAVGLGATCNNSDNNEAIIGGDNLIIKNMYLGMGRWGDFTTVGDFKLQISSPPPSGNSIGLAAQTDASGFDFIIAGSQSTGSGTGGDIVFQVSPAGGAGQAANALVTKMKIKGTGIIDMTLPTGNAGLSAGDLYKDTAANILANSDYVIGMKA